ncbi:MAG TPA: branched-chain amino acid ABC transporter permease [Gaiellaceae bacterium]|nr:branched-chain amino acid ABC transporter permease [Gaiellaceae bacterium]
MTALRYALRAAGLALFVAVVVYVPFRISDFRSSEFALIGIYFIAILGLNILTGYTGAISLGHGAFMAIGAYTTAILVADHGMRDLWTIAIAGLVAAAAGTAFGLPALRLSGPYLALATFGIAVATPIVIKKFDGFTGGSGGINLFEAEGITGLPEFVVTLPGGHQLSFNDWLYYLTWTIALVLFVVAWGIHHSRLGRSLRAIRDNELAAAASGVWLASHKTLAFTLSAFYAGVAGALLAISAFSVQPGAFPVERSIALVVGLAVGGLGSLAPLVAGAAFLVFLPQWAQDISKAPGVPSVIYGVVLILLMMVLPMGVGGLLRRIGSPLTSRLYRRS